MSHKSRTVVAYRLGTEPARAFLEGYVTLT